MFVYHGGYKHVPYFQFDCYCRYLIRFRDRLVPSDLRLLDAVKPQRWQADTITSGGFR